MILTNSDSNDTEVMGSSKEDVGSRSGRQKRKIKAARFAEPYDSSESYLEYRR